MSVVPLATFERSSAPSIEAVPPSPTFRLTVHVELAFLKVTLTSVSELTSNVFVLVISLSPANILSSSYFSLGVTFTVSVVPFATLARFSAPSIEAVPPSPTVRLTA